MALWLVRAGSKGEAEALALEKNVAVIGWSELPDLSTCTTREALEQLLQETYPDKKPRALSNWLRQIWAFIHRMKEGDLVALPLKSRPNIAFGEVTGPYRYRPDFPPYARHTRPVRWIKEIPRSDIDQDLLYSLGAFLTVGEISRHDAEARIRALLEGRPSTVFPPEEEPTEESAPTDIEAFARDQIRDFITRRFKGHKLAHLVGAVLEAQGHKVLVSPEGPDGGIDILAGGGPMGFDSPRLCVQVKSGDAPIESRVLRELQGVMDNVKADHGLLVSWSGFKSSVEKEARRLFFRIRLWDSDDLVERILAHYERLPDGLKAELPLKRIWILLMEE